MSLRHFRNVPGFLKTGERILLSQDNYPLPTLENKEHLGLVIKTKRGPDICLLL